MVMIIDVEISLFLYLDTVRGLLIGITCKHIDLHWISASLTHKHVVDLVEVSWAAVIDVDSFI